MSDNIKVVVKVRPLITREIAEKQVYQWRVHNNTLHQLDSNSRDVVQTFTFDKIYNENAKTSDVYNDVAKPIVEAATAGFNGTIFAYGQTSSGKTYTMTGTEDSPGIIPLAVFNLFENIKNIPNRDFLVRVSYLEIYNETLKDLLDIKRENIKIHETYDGNIKVDASENVTASPEEVLEAMKKGEANRQTGATNMNEKSSRSHSIFQITIESREHIEGEEQTGCVNVSQLNLVDLAGSERAGQTGATGLRFKEGTHINKSLSALALVIKQLSDDPNKYANYRDSKLTRILQNSLGGNAKTSIICAITPAAIEETISTLQFATRAKAIKNKPEVNAVVEADKTMIQGLTKQLSKLQTELQNKKNLEVMLENKKHVEQDLQKQIANLQKLILNGFGRRQSIEHIGGTRRMLQAPRRQTISTLHSISDDPVPDVPRFCTPHLKYNPLTVQNPSEFVPLQSGNKLPSLPEEPPRLITTPPSNRRVQFKAGHEDIIELDSDDEEDPETSVSTCSPYHRCYSVRRFINLRTPADVGLFDSNGNQDYPRSLLSHETKTPPCVLRRNAKEAEKNYNEIIEFTTLEKMYEPTVIELMQKIEQSTIMTTKLQDEIETLRQSSKQKDLEVEHLQCKIKKNEEEFKKTKLELDTCRKEFMTKLTDWEVSYETLQKKAKLREDDLLSLLEEQKQKKCEEIGKQPQKNLETISFIDMSIKDISLVTSDNENSIINPNEDSEKRQDLVTTLQDQLTTKNQVILQLEADIASQKKFIEHLEQSSSDIQKSFDEISTKAGYLEDENKLLQTNVDTLNATLKCQKENFEAVQIDMNSYKSLIQELQIKLSNKDNLLSMNINNSTLENMIANEEKALANNENMKNIIHCFKLTLDNRTKEIEDLKSSMKTSRDIASMDCIEKTKQIDTLNEEIFALKEQINDSIKTINNLIQEKKNLSKVEKELTEKLSEVERQKNELYELNKENAVQIDKLKEISDSNLSLLNAKEQEYANNSRQLQSQIDTLTKKIMETEEDYKEKSIILIELEKHNKEKQDFELKAKLAVDKLQNVISILNGEVKQIPELLDDLIALFNTMFIGFNTLEQLANDTVADKNNVIKQNTQLKTDIVEIHTKYDNEITSLQRDIENTKKSVENQLTENAYLKNANDKLTEEIKEIRKELEGKCKEYKTLQELCENIKVSENSLKEKLQNLQHDILVQKTYETDKLKCDLIEKCSEIANLERKLNDLTQVKEHFVDSISAKLCRIISELKTENTLEDRSKYDLEHILSMLDTIVNYIEHNNSVNAQNVATIEHVLHNSKQELETALVENNTLKNKLSDIESENKKLTLELERNYVDGKNMNENLTLSNDLLEQLREDLRIKAAEIESMENKAKEWKEQFLNLDTIMKEQMTYLQHENENLKSRVEELKFTSKQKVDTLTNYDENGSGFKEDTSKPEVKGLIETMSPPSLLTICCNTIVEAIEPKQNDYCSDITSSSDAESPDNVKCSTCEQLSLDLRFSKQENSALTTIIEHLEIANKDLLQEQGNIRREVQLLLEPAQELHKKIAGHKTNLSILTATSYAENKLLKSQVKSLQHHHNRFLNVCARDIPEFKRQLNELWTVLKEDSTASAAQNINLKRYSLPDVLDNFKNESTLDGDLLMLDTNVTLTTTGNNTLVGCDQTCLDITQTYNEVSCQTDEIDQTDVHSHTSLIDIGNQNNMSQNLEILKEQNCKLKELFDNVSVHSKVDAITSPIKIPTPDVLCKKCTLEKEMPKLDYKEVERLTQIVTQMQTEKDIIETKYNNLLLEVPSTDKLVIKIKDLEKVLNIKTEEINKLNGVLNKNLIEMKLLQEENDSLSTQVMENISEADDLHKELDRLKALNLELIEKIQKYETDTVNNTEIRQLDFKDDVVNSENKASPHSKLGRSFSDSDTTTTYNKICTLQNELCAGREDCKELREDVASIKLQLECSNMSIDLNENTEDTKDGKPQYHETKSCMPDIQEERLLDIYSVEKNDCCNYYREITGVDKEHLQSDIKIVDIMKMFYENLVTKHSNEVENLLNKLKDYEELRNTLQKKIDDMTSEYTTITETVLKKEKDLKIVSKIIHQLNAEINKINLQVSNLKDREDLKETANMFKEKILNEVDYEFGISSSNIFNMIIENYEKELFDIEKQCTSMQSQNNNLTSDLETANRNLTELKSQMTEKVKEYNLLNAQKLKIHEISSAVTMDIVKREQEINNILKESSHKLLKLNIISSELNLTGSLAHNIDTMVNCIISNIKLLLDKQKEYENEVVLKAKESAIISEQKDKEVNILKTQIQSLKDLNKNLTIELTNKELKLKDSEAQCNDLNKSYNVMEKENKNNLILINKLTEELSDAKTANLRTLKDLKEDNERLKSVNQIILKEKETYSIDLEKAGETINQNNAELGKMTSDILMLRESTKEATSIIESLKREIMKLSAENSELKQRFEEKSQECSRHEFNVRTHDKAAAIQNNIIKSLKKVKEENDELIKEKQNKIVEVTQKCTELQNECQQLKDALTTSREEVDKFKTANEVLETRISELEEATNKPRSSLEAIADSSRRRRQSLHDSKRILDLDEHDSDLFMKIDDDNSGRSTPFGLHRGRDSLPFKTDQSDRESEGGSRAAVARRRRQGQHDVRRDLSNSLQSRSRDTSATHGSNEVTQLKEQLASMTIELEGLKEKYRELDEECEICGQYLQERDAMCSQLRKENKALEVQLQELKAKSETEKHTSRHSLSKPTVADVAVNTDKDWANLHAVVVDRMSFDAEVEKNKKLKKTVEELRFKNQDLKNTMAKMQKALDKNSSKDTKELEATKEELEYVKAELQELKISYKALDEECEICAQYLREREDQCRKLREAKTALENKLQELQEASHSALAHSVRKKRQTIHDLNRHSIMEQNDASTETNEGLTSYQVERDDSSRKADDAQLREVKRLKMMIEKLSHQNAAMEQQLRSQQSSTNPVYVATGSAIVQNQQLSDVMKENQRLKIKNQKLASYCKKLTKSDANRENEDPCDQG